MNPNEFAFGLMMIAVLLGIAGYFAWRQRLTLKRLADPTMSADERLYLRGQVRRRLIGCGLMVLFAACLAGTWFLEGEYQKLVNNPEQTTAAEGDAVHSEADKNRARLIVGYWIFSLMVLLAFFVVAGFDMRAVLLDGLRKHRELRNTEKTLLEEEMRMYRRGKNGTG